MDTQKEKEDVENIAAERLVQLQYLKADLENIQKRFEKEKIEFVEFANANLIKELLNFLDSFEKAVSLEKSPGLNNLYQQFFTILEKNGLKVIEAKGKKFDPYYHEVIAKEKSDLESGTILEELQKGYLLNSKVIRQSKVKISGGNQNG